MRHSVTLWWRGVFPVSATQVRSCRTVQLSAIVPSDDTSFPPKT